MLFFPPSYSPCIFQDLLHPVCREIFLKPQRQHPGPYVGSRHRLLGKAVSSVVGLPWPGPVCAPRPSRTRPSSRPLLVTSLQAGGSVGPRVLARRVDRRKQVPCAHASASSSERPFQGPKPTLSGREPKRQRRRSSPEAGELANPRGAPCNYPHVVEAKTEGRVGEVTGQRSPSASVGARRQSLPSAQTCGSAVAISPLAFLNPCCRLPASVPDDSANLNLIS